MTEKDSDVYIIMQSREHYYYFRYTGLGVNFKIEKKMPPTPLLRYAVISYHTYSVMPSPNYLMELIHDRTH